MSDEYLMALPKGYRLNQYETISVLGAGGFGVTYLARDTSLDKLVAIKEYMPSDFALRTDGSRVTAKSTSTANDFQWGLTRFLEEARTLAKFRHPNIVEVYQVFEANQTAYIVMDYAEGETLSQHLQRAGAMDEAALTAILTPILEGLQKVHALGFLHRDIKPGNIILRTHGGPVLLDFGAARQAVEAKSRSITSVVTEGFAPIEQYASNGHQGTWTDIYALGAVAYKCLTGETPPAATMRIRNDPMIPAAAIAVGKASPQFLAAVDWALSPDEQDRPQTIAEWLAALKGALDAEKTMLARAGDATRAVSPATRRMVAPPVMAQAATHVSSAPRPAAARPGMRLLPIGGAVAAALLLIAGGAWWFTIGNIPADEREAWAATENVNTVDAYQEYLHVHPDGHYTAEARQRLATGLAKLDDFAWWWASKQNNPDAYRNYLNQYPSGQHAGDAKAAVTSAQHAALVERGQEALRLAGFYSGPSDGKDSSAFGTAVRNYQHARGMAESGHVDEVLVSALDQDNAQKLRDLQIRQQRESAAYARALSRRERALYLAFLHDFPASPHVGEIRQHLASCHMATQNEDQQATQLITASANFKGSGDGVCGTAQQQAMQSLSAQCTTGRLADTMKTKEDRDRKGGAILGSIFKLSATCTVAMQAQCVTTHSVTHQTEICS